MPIHPAYRCTCGDVPTPLTIDGEESGLCFACKYVYDEPLYEMRYRQHVPGVPEGIDLDGILRQNDPNYKRLVGA